MTDSRSNSTEATENFQPPVFNVAVSSNTNFAQLATNASGTVSNIGHVDASITTAGAVIVIDAFIEVGADPKACTATGIAFSIPT